MALSSGRLPLKVSSSFSLAAKCSTGGVEAFALAAFPHQLSSTIRNPRGRNVLNISKHTLMLVCLLAMVVILVSWLTGPVSAQLVLDDSLQGSTTGTRNGGTFANGGWQVTGVDDYIFWHLPYSVSHGAAEFYVKGINPNQPEKNEHFHMYDYTWYNSDNSYAPGYRDNPYKVFIRKSGVNDGAKNNSCEIVASTPLGFIETDSPVLSWNSSTNYKIRAEWGPEGGNTRLTLYRDGAQFFTQTFPGAYTPTGHSVRIAKCRGSGEGAQIGAVYSYLKVWDMTNNIPSAPAVSNPTNGSTVKSNLVYVKWTGQSHTQYQVRICTANDPNTGIVWDSGQVTSSRDWAWTGALGDMSNYYVFVKLGSGSGWSDWSAGGYSFRADSSYSASNNVLVQGDSLRDNNGPFLGLGFTYMRSLQRCKYDRSRWQSDMAAMASKGFNYQRILSEVDWTGLEIAPVTFPSGFPAWPDYWSQFDYDIDTAYDTYGIRTEVTIFASDYTFANDAAKYAHVDNILAHCNARPEKIAQIEVANEGWQNGFPDEAVTRAFCQYMADRTSIPVSITAPADESNTGIQTLYGSGPADIATCHLSRDLGTADGHWGPVIDCWRLANLYPGVPPVSSNEPIGSGSSVSTEDHPNHLCAAACFAWIANLPMYVYHSKAGTTATDTNGNDVPFHSTAGFSAYQYLKSIIPPDVSSWVRNDGIETAAPFTVYCNGQANKYWTDVAGATTGCHRNIGAIKGIEFICFTQGVLGGGVTYTARQQVTFKVYDPLTGAVVLDTVTKNAGDQFTLPQGNEIYIIKGGFGPSLPGQLSKTLVSKGPRTLTIDGNPADWNLSEYTTLVRGGQSGSGDTALIGFDGATRYYGSYSGVLPTSAADHTAKIYSRNDAGYIYFLVRCDDSDLRYSNATSVNWQNDCVEFYIDPAHDNGATALNNSSSDIHLVIDANNQENVYCTTTAYAAQILNGVTSAVTRDATGWWLEVKLSKTALDPHVSTGDTIGVDFNFRDNDNNNDAAQTTIYTWNDSSYLGFPSKIPNNWGDLLLDNYQTPYSGVIAVPGVIQAENYDVGGKNVSFFDTTPGNSGTAYRSDDVDVEATADTGGGYDIGYVTPGEWLEYTINVAADGDYNVKARVSSAVGGGTFKVLIDGTDLTGVESFADTGGWQNWITIIAPAKHLTAGQHILRLSMENAGLNVNYLQLDSVGADAVSVDLGTTNVEDGMTHISGGDGNTSPATIGGHYCRTNATPGADSYMYFNVADTYAYQGSKPFLDITVEYYDTGTGYLALNYDSLSSAWTDGSSVTLTNSNTWKTATFHVGDAYFGNRENYGADFRIARGNGVPFYIDTVTVGPGAPDTTPPGNVTAFAATPGDLANMLTWTNPTDLDFSGVKIVYKTTGYPTGPTDETPAYDGPGAAFLHTGLTNGTLYYYKAFAHDSSANYASGAQASARPVDAGAPANVTGFAASPGDHQITLTWTNPASGYTGIKIVFKTGSYPTGQADGTQIYNSTGTSYTHTGLTNGTMYFYKAFAHDEIPNYASGASANALPSGPVTINSSTFDSDANGWTLSTWKYSTDPTVIPVCAWTSGVGNPGGGVCSIGAGQTDNADKCLREGGEGYKVISTVGYHDIQVSYDVRSNSLGGDYTGAGTGGSCAMDHGLVDEQLTIFYSTNGGTSWTEAEYIARATLLTYQTYGTRTISLASVPAANDNAAFALRFRWQLNHVSDIVDLDNIVVKGTGAGDTTPPANASSFAAVPGNAQVVLSWANPTDPDFAGTRIMFKTTGYPTGPTDGTQIYDSNGITTTHAALTNGVTYYYRAFAHDGALNFASGVQVSTMPVANATIAVAKTLADGQVRALRGNVVSATITGGFYIQDPLGPYAIKVTGATASQGQKVDVMGAIRGQASERYMDCTGYSVTVTDPSPAPLHISAIGNLSLGGATLNGLAPGVLAAQGPNNLGLLIYAYGKVTQRDRSLQFFYIDDGSGRSDGTQTETSVGVFEPSVGVRVKADPTNYAKGSYVGVTGISSCYTDAGVMKALVVPKTGGIQKLRQ